MQTCSKFATHSEVMSYMPTMLHLMLVFAVCGGWGRAAGGGNGGTLEAVLSASACLAKYWNMGGVHDGAARLRAAHLRGVRHTATPMFGVCWLDGGYTAARAIRYVHTARRISTLIQGTSRLPTRRLIRRW